MKKQRLVVYPAILISDEHNSTAYTVTFPDVPSAITQGIGLAPALKRAEEVLGLMLYDESDLPEPTPLQQVTVTEPHGLATLVVTDLEETKRRVTKTTVKKNTTIPANLAALAEEQHLNFSALLTNALKKELDR